MTLTPRTLAITLMIIGTGVLLTTTAFTPTIDHLICQRQNAYTAVCRLKGFSLLGLPVRQVVLDPLKGAEQYPQSAGEPYVTRVLLYTSGQPQSTESKIVPFSRYGISASAGFHMTEDINNFLASPETKSFDRWQSAPFLIILTAMIGSLFLFLLGLIILWVNQVGNG